MSDWGEDILAAEDVQRPAPANPQWRSLQVQVAIVAAGVVVALVLVVAVLSYVLYRGDVRDGEAAQQQSETQQLQSALCGVLDELTTTAGTPAEAARIDRASLRLGCSEEDP